MVKLGLSAAPLQRPPLQLGCGGDVVCCLGAASGALLLAPVLGAAAGAGSGALLLAPHIGYTVVSRVGSHVVVVTPSLTQLLA